MQNKPKNIEIKLLFWIICAIVSTHLIAQPSGYSKEIIVERGIVSITGILNIVGGDSMLNGTKIAEYDFDDFGRCVRKKTMRPFIDVVTVSVEYIFEYDDFDNVVNETKILKREPLTEKERRFTAMFGEDIDTTITEFYYEEGYLAKSIRYNPEKKDTLVELLRYQDTLLTGAIHYSTSLQGKLNRQNYKIRYYYDQLGRLIREEKQYEGSELFSTNEIWYVEKSDKKSKENSCNGFSWSITRHGNGGEEHELVQDSLDGRIIEYYYNQTGELIEKKIYPDLSDLTQVTIQEFETPGGGVKREYMSGNVKGSIYLSNNKEEIFDLEGLLIQERILKKGEVMYSCDYEVQYK